MKIRPIAFVSMVLALVASNGCGPQTAESPETGSAPSAEEEIRLGFLVKMPEELWFQNEWRFAQQCADKYGFELIKIGVPDGEKLLAAIDVLAAKGAQGFVVCTPDVPVAKWVGNSTRSSPTAAGRWRKRVRSGSRSTNSTPPATAPMGRSKLWSRLASRKSAFT